MNVCMRQPVVHAIQLYDIIPAKRRRIEKLNFGGKEIKMKNESCVTLELRTLCGDRRMRVRETADEGRGWKNVEKFRPRARAQKHVVSAIDLVEN